MEWNLHRLCFRTGELKPGHVYIQWLTGLSPALAGKIDITMTTFAQWSRPGSRLDAGRLDRRQKKYDVRVVDHFYGYCVAVARTHRHRDEAQVQSQFATRRAIVTVLFAGGALCYYLLERLSQFIPPL